VSHLLSPLKFRPKTEGFLGCSDGAMLDLQIVSDLKTLRTLAEYLLILDPVTFLGYLENLRAAESINSIWLFHDAAHTIFEQVKATMIGSSSFLKSCQ